MTRRVLLVGLDCAPPALVFDRYLADMPNLAGLMARGCHGPLRSTTPPITIPAWTSMLSGYDPGALGLYGFTRQLPDSYQTALASGDDVRVPRVWERLRSAGKRVASLFVPPSFPVRAHADVVVSCFMTPDAEATHTHPAALAEELRARFGPYQPDVEGFRDGDRARILADIHDMSEQHFDIARHVWTRERPDFMAMVDLGPDRLHHAFWSAMDASHPLHDTADPFVDAGRNYYAFVDRQLGALLSEVDDETTVLVVSDHGARALRGGVCINEWLMREGYLVLEDRPGGIAPLSQCKIDYARSRAWAAGGYCGRVFINRQGLRPEGIVDDTAYGPLLAELRAGLAAIETPASPRPHRILTPEQCYPDGATGMPPDLSVFFGDLDLRAIGSVGHGRLLLAGDDRGDDGCNHDWDGIFIMSGAGVRPRGPLAGLSILDVTPTILALFDQDIPAQLRGVDRNRA